MEKQGSRQVPVVGKEDKREITVLLTVTATGKLLPPQVIHTRARHLAVIQKYVTFPSSWNITHSESHWSTEETMLEYIDQVLVPCVSHKQDKNLNWLTITLHLLSLPFSVLTAVNLF